jgi:endothelin-converting enzyme
LSRFFVEKAFSAKAKEFGDRIVSDIKDLFIEKLKATKWMEDSVTELAIHKVHNIVQKIGYPTKVCIRDVLQQWGANVMKSPDIMDPNALRSFYKDVTVNSDTFFQNTISIIKFGVGERWKALGKPVDKNEWYVIMTAI